MNKKPKFEVGQIVRVKWNADKIKSKRGVCFVASMMSTLGQTITIAAVQENKDGIAYRGTSDGLGTWFYDEDWLEPLSRKRKLTIEFDGQDVLAQIKAEDFPTHVIHGSARPGTAGFYESAKDIIEQLERIETDRDIRNSRIYRPRDIVAMEWDAGWDGERVGIVTRVDYRTTTMPYEVKDLLNDNVLWVGGPENGHGPRIVRKVEIET